MPYKTITALPDSVRAHLPEHAQHIYLEAFNHAMKEYTNPDKRRDPSEDREIIAHKVAWAAVKTKYHKTPDGSWKEN
jgi:cation transport regulator